jgi:hypothetical protein
VRAPFRTGPLLDQHSLVDSGLGPFSLHLRAPRGPAATWAQRERTRAPRQYISAHGRSSFYGLVSNGVCNCHSDGMTVTSNKKGDPFGSPSSSVGMCFAQRAREYLSTRATGRTAAAAWSLVEWMFLRVRIVSLLSRKVTQLANECKRFLMRVRRPGEPGRRESFDPGAVAAPSEILPVPAHDLRDPPSSRPRPARSSDSPRPCEILRFPPTTWRDPPGSRPTPAYPGNRPGMASP